MATNKKRSIAAGPLAKRFNLMEFTDDLIRDLDELRAGKISPKDASVRAELAKQVLRAIGLVVTAQKFIEGNAKVMPSVSND
jgi:hypothetical protein